ncbi:Predicted ABC-type ATPase [Variovorax sp. OK605]|jgi:predicted ABC-type ATPase|uniref:zeta toxin family protein n=1 Tax=Variovorax sp. OK605 TaxID=1855317 RepID=UPI0008E80577|nr:zeta toxin family protein [Variovorax sp. OK605]SFQ28800.1 Predicted ABC-type ATPase [Variovorax sp. OK605]
MPARIFVLAGVNGAGKSSVGGAALLHKKVDYFNPDLAARVLLDANPRLAPEAANAQAWEIGRKGLARALAEGQNFAFETTLGARTISQMLVDGARLGAQVHLWYAGLSSPELHLQRVRSRVVAGGHDIPEAKIRERYETSRANLIRLLPWLASLRLYDNSAEGDPKAGCKPQPRLLLHMEGGRIAFHIPLDQVPQWAKPIMAAALA